MTTVKARVDATNADALLEQLPLVLRGKYVKQGVRAAGRVVANDAKRRIRKPGYEGDKPGKKPLRETVRVELRDYGDWIVSVVGPEYPAGAHGHLVESGHRIVTGGTAKPLRGKNKSAPRSKRTGQSGQGDVAGMVPAYPFLEPAADSTIPQQQAAFEGKIRGGVEKEARAAVRQ